MCMGKYTNSEKGKIRMGMISYLICVLFGGVVTLASLVIAGFIEISIDVKKDKKDGNKE